MVGLFDKPLPSRRSPQYEDMLERKGMAARACCEDIWSDFEDFADPNFKTEFAARTHSRWFEMYLTVSLLRAGHEVDCPKPGPDVLLKVGGQRIWIEAVCASAGDPRRSDSVPRTVFGKVVPEPTEQYVLRIRNALDEKQRKFRKYLDEGIVSVGDVMVVAMNVFEIDGLGPHIDSHFMRALYGVGDPVIQIGRHSGEVRGVGNARVESVKKKASGAEVGVQPFIDGTMEHVTAVLGSYAYAFECRTQLGDDFVLYPNLTGDVSWPPGVLQVGAERRVRPARALG